jgi:hypothetical protein
MSKLIEIRYVDVNGRIVERVSTRLGRRSASTVLSLLLTAKMKQETLVHGGYYVEVKP